VVTRSWSRKLFARTPRASREDSGRFRPGLEALEDRLVPATFTVFNLNDSGPGSLRQAVTDANSSAEPTSSLPVRIGRPHYPDHRPTGRHRRPDRPGPGADVLKVSGGDATRLFEVAAVPPSPSPS